MIFDVAMASYDIDFLEIFEEHNKGNGGNISQGKNEDNKKGENDIHFTDLKKYPTTLPYFPEYSTEFQLLTEILEENSFSELSYFPSLGTSSLLSKSILNELKILKFVLINRVIPDSKDAGKIVYQWNEKENFEESSKNISSTPKENSLTNFAYQVGTPSGRIVFINMGLFLKMSEKRPRHLAAFLMHEALISLWYKSRRFLQGHLASTEEIGNIVNNTFQTIPGLPPYNPLSLTNHLCSAGLKVSKGQLQGYKMEWLISSLKSKIPSTFIVRDNKECQQVRHFEVQSSNRYSKRTSYSHLSVYIIDLWELLDGERFKAKLAWTKKRAKKHPNLSLFSFDNSIKENGLSSSLRNNFSANKEPRFQIYSIK